MDDGGFDLNITGLGSSNARPNVNAGDNRHRTVQKKHAARRPVVFSVGEANASAANKTGSRVRLASRVSTASSVAPAGKGSSRRLARKRRAIIRTDASSVGKGAEARRKEKRRRLKKQKKQGGTSNKKRKHDGEEEDEDARSEPAEGDLESDDEKQRHKKPVMSAAVGALAGEGGKVASGKSFGKLKIHDSLVRQLEFLKFTNCTPIQSSGIPPALNGRDVLFRAPTGSGKTIAFLLPVLHRLLELSPAGHSRSKGTLAVILSPTKELALQTLKVAQDLVRMVPSLVCGAVAGGEKPKSEKARLRKGLALLCATPGRLAYHLQNTEMLKTDNCMCLVLDEADRLLDMGFEPQVRGIHKHLVGENQSVKSKKQTVQILLASATLSHDVRRLGEFCLRKDAFWADVGSDGGEGTSATMADDTGDRVNFSVPSTLTQWYCIVPCKERLVALISAILSRVTPGRGHYKAMVFFSANASVDFHHDLFTDACWPQLSGFNKRKTEGARVKKFRGGFVGIRSEEDEDGVDDDYDDEDRVPSEKAKAGRPKVFAKTRIFKLHGNLQKEERAGYIGDFAHAEGGVLLASDAAARGLDFPQIDWIIQYDPPQRAEEYLHRVGRTARIGKLGNALLFLQPSEVGFLDFLRERGLHDLRELTPQQLISALPRCGGSPPELTYVRDLATFMSAGLMSHVGSCAPLAAQARSALMAVLRSYRSFSRELRPFFPADQLHTGHLAASFGLREAPKQAAKKEKSASLDDSGRGAGKGRGRAGSQPRCRGSAGRGSQAGRGRGRTGAMGAPASDEFAA